MTSIQVNIINPKAIRLLKDLVELELISIQELPTNGFKATLDKLRVNAKNAPTLDEITKEVEMVRTKRYAH